MSIRFDRNDKIFTIHTRHTTYQMKADRYGFLLHLYYGRRTEGHMEYLLSYADRGFSGSPYDAGNDRSYSLDALPQELPCQGTGDYRSPALIIRNKDGSYGCDLRFRGYRICEGKYGIPGLPSVYADEEEAQTLEIDLEDAASQVRVTLLYGVLPDLDIITRSACISNEGGGRLCLEKVQAACLDFLWGDYELLTFCGRHAMERQLERTPVGPGSHLIGSRRGTSSHQYNPMMILAESGTTEDAGNCWAMSFVYSGNFKGEAERDQYGQTRMQLGLSDELFSYPLESGERFYAPEVLLSFSSDGLSALSQNLHRCIREHVCRGKYRDGGRPILLNSWEACYLDMNGDCLLSLARSAAELGVDLLVLDDGWFGARTTDNSGLGDWQPNEERLGAPLPSIVREVNRLGLKFGIWIEPECVNEDSELYRAHPDWVFQVPGRKPVRGRNQLVLDFSRPEVTDCLFDAICRLLDSANIEYVKWDMNRSLADCYSAATSDQGRVMHDYILGLYRFLDRLTQRYPDLLLESCSGGGGRFDAGMLYYSPQIWCSDNTDAADRLRIQYGTSFGYPVCAMGSHVSAVPNHQTGRTTPLATRGTVAMAGSFGYELDPRTLTAAEKEEIRLQIAHCRRFAPLIHHGRYYRLGNPSTENVCGWIFVSEDGTQALLQGVVQRSHGNMPANYIRLRGLTEGHLYRDENGSLYGAEALMQAGWRIPPMAGDFRSFQLYLTRVDEEK